MNEQAKQSNTQASDEKVENWRDTWERNKPMVAEGLMEMFLRFVAASEKILAIGGVPDAHTARHLIADYLDQFSKALVETLVEQHCSKDLAQSVGMEHKEFLATARGDRGAAAADRLRNQVAAIALGADALA